VVNPYLMRLNHVIGDNEGGYMKFSPALRAVFGFTLVAALLLPGVAFASSYYSTLSLTYHLQGQTRSYTGTNMNIYMYAHATVSSATTFTVKLYRDNPWPISNDYIGYSSFPRNGGKTATWSNVGSGNYFFDFSKINDGITIWSDNVHMYN